MVVMTVMGIATLIGLNSLTDSKTSTASYEAQRVRDTMIKARDLARFHLKCVEVNVLPHAIEITPYDVCSPALASPRPMQRVDFLSTITLAQFNIGNPVRFNAGGGLQSAGPAEMTVAMPSGGQKTLTVMPAIGTVSMR